MDHTLALNGDQNIGVFTRVFDDIAFVPSNSPDEYRASIKDAFDVEVIPTFIQGSSLIGLLLTGNSKGFVVSGLIKENELNLLQEYGDTLLLGEEMNAAGNVILTNNSFAIVHPNMSKKMRSMIGEFLKVKTIPMSVGGIGTVGMTGVCTDSGILLPSNTTSTEIETLEKEISDPNFPIGTGSINMGSRLIGTGLIINNKNYLAGFASSGFELGRVEDVFGFI